jgi:hypothetical protein
LRPRTSVWRFARLTDETQEFVVERQLAEARVSGEEQGSQFKFLDVMAKPAAGEVVTCVRYQAFEVSTLTPTRSARFMLD